MRARFMMAKLVASTEQIPLLARGRVQRVARQGKRDPRPAVDKDRLALANHGMS
jgi:hypothetical protein